MCQFLIEAKADVNAKDNMCSPLYTPLRARLKPVAGRLFCVEPYNSHTRSPSGWNPLHWSSRRGHLDTCRFLIVEAKADVNAKTNECHLPPPPPLLT
jgi:hypothetical protein